MTVLRAGLRLLREHKKVYLALNLTLYGTVAIAMALGIVFPRLHADTLARTNEQLRSVSFVVDAYARGDVALAAPLTFAINLAVGALGTISVPSLLVPFSGVALTVWRFVQWGLLFPPDGANALALLPHYLTLILEGQAYVLAAFGATLQGRMLLRPARFRMASRWAGLRSGLVLTVQLYPLIALLLLVAAIYEALEVVFLLGP